MPDYDNLVLSHADRRRVISDVHRPTVFLSAGSEQRFSPTASCVECGRPSVPARRPPSRSSPSRIKEARLGAQVGTTSLDFINETVQPNEDSKIYDTTNDAKSALESGQIDAFVTDLVTTVYLRDFEIDNSVVVGQYPRNEQFGMLFEEGNPLVGCVNEVLGEMKSDGTLEELKKEYLQQYLSVPTLKD